MNKKSHESPSFVIALPMFNEEAYADKCIRSIFSILNNIHTQNGIVVVNDGSWDKTSIILEDVKKDFDRLYIIEHPVNQGYGSAIISAYRFGIEYQYDYVLFMDADLTQDPRFISAFLPHMANGVDFIKASRYIKGSRVFGVSRFRMTVSLFGNLLARIAFRLPITDYTNGFRAVKTSVAKHFELKASHFEILVEEMWQAKFFAKSFSEINYVLQARENAQDSKFQYTWKVYKQYLKYCLYALLRVSPHETRLEK